MRPSRAILPNGWDRDIPEDRWPEALIAAVRYDVRALGSQRVIETIAAWRERTASKDSTERKTARELLHALGRALVLPPPRDDEPTRALPPDDAFPSVPDPSADLELDEDEYLSEVGEPTVANVPPPPPRQPPPPPPPSRVGPPPLPSKPPPAKEGPTEALDALRMISELIEEEAAGGLKTRIAETPPGLGNAQAPEEREGSHGNRPTQFNYSSLVSEEFADHEKPTTANPNPTGKRSSSLFVHPPPALMAPESAIEPPAETTAAPEIEQTVAEAKIPSSRSEPAKPISSRSRVPPNRRHAGSPSRRTSRRPRASMVQIKPLYPKILALSEELIPLTYERRSRRFWSLWREVSGDKLGIRRDAVEELLSKLQDGKELAIQLISEAHGVDPDSVAQLVIKLEAESDANAER